MTERTVSLKQYRALAADARAALRMIREVVEKHALSNVMCAPRFALAEAHQR